MKRRRPPKKVAKAVAEERSNKYETVTSKQEAYVECVKQEYEMPEESNTDKTSVRQVCSKAISDPAPSTAAFERFQMNETIPSSNIKFENRDDEYLQICRGCLSTDKTNLVSIFKDGVSNIFEEFCGIKVDKEENISSMICNVCRYKVLDQHFFRDVCITNTRMLWYRSQTQHGLLECNPGGNSESHEAIGVVVENTTNVDVPFENTESENQFLAPPICTPPQKKKKKSTLKISRQEIQAPNTQQQSSNATDVLKKLSCPVCHKEYSTKPGLLQHLESHKGQDPSTFTVECPVCKVLRRRKDKHKCVDNKLKCYLCETSCRNWSYLKIHLKKAHNVRGSRKQIEAKRVIKYPTVVAPSKMRLKPSNVNAPTVPIDDALFACCHCGEAYKSLSFLSMHRKIHAQVCRTQCNVCLFIFRSYRVLETHFDKHEDFYETEPGSHSCPECQKQFHRRQTVLLHLQVEHENRDVTKCSKCFYMFANQGALGAHNCEANPLKVTPAVEPVKKATRVKDWKEESPEETEVDISVSDCESASEEQFTKNQSSNLVIIRAVSVLGEVDLSSTVSGQPQSEDNALPLNDDDNVIDITHEDTVDNFICTDCNLVFLKQDTLHRHMKLHKKRF